MRRLLVVLVLLTTIAARWAEAGLARVVPAPGPGGHHSHAQKLARKVVTYARHQIGVSYSWGGTSRQTGFGCSGLVYAGDRSIGCKLPRSSRHQLRAVRPVGFPLLPPGDMVFTEGGGHVQ